ncbi:MAG: hypothetical protein RIF41_37870, partial [Polyangiaceae bacterium]
RISGRGLGLSHRLGADLGHLLLEMRIAMVPVAAEAGQTRGEAPDGAHGEGDDEQFSLHVIKPFRFSNSR